MKKTLLAVFAVLLLASFTLAEEVVLEPQDTPANRPVMVYGRINDQFEFKILRKAPQGVTAPDGKLTWGKLTMGELSYLLCFEVTGKDSKLYLDLDGDKDLAEETAISGKAFGRIRPGIRSLKGAPGVKKKGLRVREGMDKQFLVADPPRELKPARPLKGKPNRIRPGIRRWEPAVIFEVENVPASFKVGDKTIDLDMKVRLNSRGASIGVYTYYEGKIKACGKDAVISWLPGQPAQVGPLMMKGRGQTTLFGNKRICLADDCITLKDGKVIATYTIEVDKSLVLLKAPEGMGKISLYVRGGRPILCTPEDGKVYVPTGTYYIARTEYVRQDKGDTWKAMQTLRNFEITDDSKFSDIEPLQIKLTATIRGGVVNFQPLFCDSQNQRISLRKNNRSVPAPKVFIKNASGEVVETFQMRFS